MSRLLRVLIAVLVVLGSGPRLPARADTALAVGIIPAEVAAEAAYGSERGFFARHGLDVTVTNLNNGGAIGAAIASGAIQVGISDLITLANAHARGLDLVCLAPGLQYNPGDHTYALFVRGDAPIRDARDLDGKTISSAGLNNIAAVGVRAWIDGNGGASASDKFVEIPLPAEAAAVSQGTVAAATAVEPFVTRAVDQGLRPFYLDKNGMVPFYFGCWTASRAWIEKNPATAAAFRAAIFETARWANANRSAAAPLLSKFSSIPLDLVERMHHGTFAEAYDVKYVQPVIDAAVRYGIIAKSFPASELFAQEKL